MTNEYAVDYPNIFEVGTLDITQTKEANEQGNQVNEIGSISIVMNCALAHKVLAIMTDAFATYVDDFGRDPEDFDGCDIASKALIIRELKNKLEQWEKDAAKIFDNMEVTE